MRGIDLNVLLACGYSVFLALMAVVLELIARHSHQRTQKIETVGFSYHPELDIWKCPSGKHLYRAEITKESITVLYRAPAHHCNSCSVKTRCTDSNEGRTIQVQPDSWLQSELRKFHRGLSLTLLALADLILAVTILTRNNIRDEILLGFVLLCITGPGLRLATTFLRN